MEDIIMHILDMPVEESLETLNLIIDNLALIADDRLRKELESIDFIQTMLQKAYKKGRTDADGTPHEYEDYHIS